LRHERFIPPLEVAVSNAQKRTVSLTEEWSAYIDAKVASGRIRVGERGGPQRLTHPDGTGRRDGAVTPRDSRSPVRRLGCRSVSGEPHRWPHGRDPIAPHRASQSRRV